MGKTSQGEQAKALYRQINVAKGGCKNGKRFSRVGVRTGELLGGSSTEVCHKLKEKTLWLGRALWITGEGSLAKGERTLKC